MQNKSTPDVRINIGMYDKDRESPKNTARLNTGLKVTADKLASVRGWQTS